MHRFFAERLDETNAVLPPEERREPGKKPSVRARLRTDRERGKAAKTSREHRAGKWETEI